MKMKHYLQVFLLFFPILVLLAIYAPTLHFFANQYDDSYITYRYAINLAEGNGLVFNIGERTDAASSFLYTLILSLSWLLGANNLEFVGGFLGILSLGFISLFVYKLAFFLSDDRNASLIVAVACGLNGLLSGWALSGMETLPWAAIVLLTLYLIVIDAHYAAIILAIASAVFMRFEGIFLVASYLTVLVMRPSYKKELSLLVLVIIAFSFFYIVKYYYYGVWISHAFQMKEVADYYQAAPRELIRYWGLFVSVPLILCIPSLLSKKYIGVTTYICISLISVVLGPKSDWSRYSVHLLPLLYAFSVPVLAGLISNPRTAIRVIGFVVALIMILQAIAGEVFNWRNMTSLAEHQICRKDLGQFIHSKISNEEYIASSDIGAISYMAINHRFIDLAALTSADVLAQYQVGKTADDIMAEKKVKYIADTFSDSSSNLIDSLLRQFPKVKSKSRFTADATGPEFVCTEKGGLSFILAKVALKKTNPEFGQFTK